MQRTGIAGTSLLDEGRAAAVAPTRARGSTRVERRCRVPRPCLRPLTLNQSPVFTTVYTTVTIRPGANLLRNAYPGYNTTSSLAILCSPLKDTALLHYDAYRTSSILGTLGTPTALTHSGNCRTVVCSDRHNATCRCTSNLVIHHSPAGQVSRDNGATNGRPL